MSALAKNAKVNKFIEDEILREIVDVVIPIQPEIYCGLQDMVYEIWYYPIR